MSTYVAVFALVLAYIAIVAAYLALRTLAKLRRATAVLSRGPRAGGGKQTLIEATVAHAEQTAAMAEQIADLRLALDTAIAETRQYVDGTVATAKEYVDSAQRQTLIHLDGTEQQLRKQVDETTQLTRTKAEQVAQEALEQVARGGEATTGALRNVALVRFDAFPGMSGRMSFALALLDDTGTGVTISALAGPTDTRVYAKGIAEAKGEHQLSPEESQAVASAMAKQRTRQPIRRAG